MNNKYFTFAALAGLMALTRFHHFGSALSLPDASLAIFFLAGLGLSQRGFFAALLVEAGVIDFLAIHQFSVSDYCLSPAYLFLIPTYFVMWAAGRSAKPWLNLTFVDSLKMFGLAAGAVTIAFAVSNSSFFWFSGRFDAMTWLEYINKTGSYYLPYLSSTMIYALSGLALIKCWQVSRKQAVSEIN
jgi:hypothetical protein